MLSRVLEPEVMDSAEEALDYDTMDHTEVNRRFVDDLLTAGLTGETVLDLGTGTALIPLELCRRAPKVRVTAVDAAAHMLALARRHVEETGFQSRITLAQVDAKQLPYPAEAFEAVVSNSIVHHIPEPRDVLTEAWRVLKGGGLFFMRDLARPNSQTELAHLVATYAGGANQRQQKLFAESLHAALTVEEVAHLLAGIGVPSSSVRLTSDRHWTCCCLKGKA